MWLDAGTILESSRSLLINNNKQVILVGILEEANRLFKTSNGKDIFIAKDRECIKINKELNF